MRLVGAFLLVCLVLFVAFAWRSRLTQKLEVESTLWYEVYGSKPPYMEELQSIAETEYVDDN